MPKFHRLALFCVTLVAAGQAAALDARAQIERAVELVEAGDHALAQVYLEPALIDPRLSPAERSRAYYVRGFSFQAQGLFASAAKDYHHALEFNPGNPVVLASVAQLHLDGLGVDRNPELAVDLLRQAADADLPDGMLRLGYLYLHGMGVEKNLELAREWLTKAAEKGSPQAMLQMAQSWRKPFTDPPVPEQAVDWFERAHEAGALDALAFVGFMIEGGELGEPDPVRGRERFAAAAEAGSALGQAKLAHMYLDGEGGPADVTEALRLFRASAAQGHPAGLMGLGYLYEAGVGVPADPEEALRWYTRAAEAGMVDAQLHLAYTALRRDEPEERREAADWFARAAMQGNPQAMNDYAWLLATSPDAELRDGPRALTLARRAVALERSPSHLDTLAAAYAELGRFTQAVATQRDALAAVAALDPRPANAAALEQELSAHLEAFEAGRPWRE
jgi:TPR repeat protein